MDVKDIIDAITDRGFVDQLAKAWVERNPDANPADVQDFLETLAEAIFAIRGLPTPGPIIVTIEINGKTLDEIERSAGGAEDGN